MLLPAQAARALLCRPPAGAPGTHPWHLQPSAELPELVQLNGVQGWIQNLRLSNVALKRAGQRQGAETCWYM